MSFHFTYVIAPRSQYRLRGVSFITFPGTVTLSHIKATNAGTSLTGAVPGETMTVTDATEQGCLIRRIFLVTQVWNMQKLYSGYGESPVGGRNNVPHDIQL